LTGLAPSRWLLVGAVTAAGLSLWPGTSAAATCADYPNQAAAQRVGDTRDADGDGIYCENLPCPCSSQAPTGQSHEPSQSGSSGPSGCARPRRVQRISFSANTYPNIRRHYLAAVTRGWPRTLVVTRSGADPRRERLLESFQPARGLTVTNMHPPLAAVAARAWSADLTRRGGRPMSDTSPATKTAPKARPSAPSSTASATEPSSATPSSRLATPAPSHSFRTYTGSGEPTGITSTVTPPRRAHHRS